MNLYWSMQSVRELSAKGYYNHFAITIGCGLIAIGIQAVMFDSQFYDATFGPGLFGYDERFKPTARRRQSATCDNSLAGDAATGLRRSFRRRVSRVMGPTVEVYRT